MTIPISRCAVCQRTLQKTQNQVSSGDVIVCNYCGMIHVINDKLMPVRMTPEQRAAFKQSAAWPKMVKIQQDINRKLSASTKG